MTPCPELLEEPAFQQLIKEAMQTLDFAAQCSDDNRLEVEYKRKGIQMSIIVQEKESK